MQGVITPPAEYKLVLQGRLALFSVVVIYKFALFKLADETSVNKRLLSVALVASFFEWFKKTFLI
jgi:hypothetical protein